MKIYRSLPVEEQEWLDVDYPPGKPIRDVFHGRPVAPSWTPFEVFLLQKSETGDPLLPTDLAASGVGALVLRDSARTVLEPLIGAFGEFLPIRSDEDAVWLFNPLRVLPDALDYEASWILRYEFLPFGIQNIREFVFRSERIVGIPVFRVEDFNVVFFSDAFVSTFEAHQLRGIRFIPVWDSESGAVPYPQSQTGEPPSPRAGPIVRPRRWETPLPDAEQSRLTHYRERAEQRLRDPIARLLALGRSQTPLEWVRSIEAEITRSRRVRASLDEEAYASVILDLAYLYGEQLQIAYGWEWVQLHWVEDGEEGSGIAVVSPDRTVALLPILFMKRQIDRDPLDDLTIELTFNLLNPTSPSSRPSGAAPGDYHLIR